MALKDFLKEFFFGIMLGVPYNVVNLFGMKVDQMEFFLHSCKSF